MFKKILAVAIFFFVYTVANAQQAYRIYLTPMGEKTNHPEIASSYVIVSYISDDSLWYAQQYDMRNNILTSGYYKDEQMTIAHGKFVYYKKYQALPGNPAMHQDTDNHVQLTGYFLNGVRTGPWVEYIDGVRTSVTNFKNDKMEGLYQQYNLKTGKVIKEGYYINNLKEGDWCMLDTDSTAMYTDIFKHGKMVKHLTHSNPIVDREREKEYAKKNKDAIPNFDFQTLVTRTFEHYVYSVTTGKFVMTFTITKEGKVIEPRVVQTFETPFDELAIQAMLNSRWKPAIRNGEPVSQFYFITINIRDGVAQIPGGDLHKHYNLQRGTYQ
jgi:antitoxin component YwqK of YwqJK toxin-antitoxin module